MDRTLLQNCRLLITTCERNATYMPFVLSITKQHWPACPDITIATDGGVLSGLADDIVTIPNATWIEVLLGALRHCQVEAGLPYVFLMLEDLCPIRPCDQHVIDLAIAALDRSEAGTIEFSCFDLPFSAETEAWPNWTSFDWSKSPIVNYDILRMRTLPREFPYYFSVQPGFWRLEYLIDACQTALAQGCTSPWAFEKMRWLGARPHLIADYTWPAPHHGFLLQGSPTHGAIAVMKSEACSDLRTRLITEAFGGRMGYFAWRNLDRLKRILGVTTLR